MSVDTLQKSEPNWYIDIDGVGGKRRTTDFVDFPSYACTEAAVAEKSRAQQVKTTTGKWYGWGHSEEETNKTCIAVAANADGTYDEAGKGNSPKDVKDRMKRYNRDRRQLYVASQLHIRDNELRDLKIENEACIQTQNNLTEECENLRNELETCHADRGDLLLELERQEVPATSDEIDSDQEDLPNLKEQTAAATSDEIDSDQKDLPNPKKQTETAISSEIGSDQNDLANPKEQTATAISSEIGSDQENLAKPRKSIPPETQKKMQIGKKFNQLLKTQFLNTSYKDGKRKDIYENTKGTAAKKTLWSQWTEEYEAWKKQLTQTKLDELYETVKNEVENKPPKQAPEVSEHEEVHQM
ncbi:hypothetical protein CYMTET_55083 [Cymbomonas tetramitiformis]|uniref:Uncharacterized protein n=1 Tax=Cymbomonas tetramitiformis TaxID=36881 RepID=A0AAE0ENT8_9CHLO|nr:hypothetical protein CYMTET_55083 [Cymbomonas tetramitiformis]